MPRRRWALWIVFCVGCASSGERDVREVVDPAALRFRSGEDEARFRKAHACAVKRGAGWQHTGLHRFGNFVGESWCRGVGAARGCSGGNFREQEDADWIEVETLHYDDDWPEVFGVTFDAGHRPKGTEAWSVSVWVSSNGDKILGEGAHVTFDRTGDDSKTIHLGSTYEHKVQEADFVVRAEGTPWSTFERLRASPHNLRDEGTQHWDELEAQVLAALDKGEVEKCVYGPYEGRGIPPLCIKKVPLTEEEVASERSRITTEANRVRALVADHAQELHNALVAVAPPDCI